jgi:hypothetical protein
MIRVSSAVRLEHGMMQWWVLLEVTEAREDAVMLEVAAAAGRTEPKGGFPI